jgi:hypothetical protein
MPFDNPHQMPLGDAGFLWDARSLSTRSDWCRAVSKMVVAYASSVHWRWYPKAAASMHRTEYFLSQINAFYSLPGAVSLAGIFPNLPTGSEGISDGPHGAGPSADAPPASSGAAAPAASSIAKTPRHG